MSQSKVKPCTCEHEYQDSKYGKGKRLFNPAGGSKQKKWRCTVCLKEVADS